MIQINWKRLLDQHGIEYVERGSSVVKGNIAVHCPFCGNADHGHHLGINLSNNYWGCWRNTEHRGKSPVRLLMALLKVPYAQALSLAGLDESFSDPDGYEAIKNNLFKKQEAIEQSESEIITKLEMPVEFQQLDFSKSRHVRFVNYLVEKRGFSLEYIAALCDTFRLRFAVSGDFKDRVIIPYYMDGRLVTWSGRAISETHMRYLDLSIEESIVPAKKTLYNFGATRRQNKILLVAEGPFDAITCDFYSKEYGVRCVALSTNSITEAQTYLLEEASVNFEKVLMVMDNADSLGIVDSFQLKEQLSIIKNIGFTKVPEGFKDFGEMDQSSIIKFCKEITQ